MNSTATQSAPDIQLEAFLLEVAEVVNTTLDLDALLRGVAELVRRAIDYEVFAILLLNEKTQELGMRFQIGHTPEVAESVRIKVGEGVTGLAAERGEAVLVNDVLKESRYIAGPSGVRSELAVPLIAKNRVIGVIDVEASQPGYFTAEHASLLALVASRIAVGVENACLYSRVSRQAKTLATLNEISQELTAILDLDELLKRIGSLLSRLIDYQMFSILLLDPSGASLQHRFSLRFKKSVHIKHNVPLGRGLVGYAAQHRQPVLVADVSQDPRYISCNPETRSELCVPLIHKGTLIGVLDLEHTRRGYFNDAHVRTLTTLAAQVAIAIENARLYEKIARHEKRLERDLSMARELQLHLLPPCCPDLAHAELSTSFAPATAIGGDLYDFIPYADARMAIAVGDVSGKGAPAAIYAALASGFLRSHAVREPGSAEMLAALNRSLTQRPIDAQFLSLIYALWDDGERVMRIANSGLPRPVYCRDGEIEIIEATGLPLGFFDNSQYEENIVRAQPNDIFVFFSDGILDAVNHHGELFGRRRVEQIVARSCRLPSDEIVKAISAAVSEHAAGVDAFDDQTIVAVKVK